MRHVGMSILYIIILIIVYEQSLFFLGPLRRSTLARACTPLTKSEEKERLLAVYTHQYFRHPGFPLMGTAILC